MLRTPKLLARLNRVFNKDPVQVLALRFTYSGTMQWTVADGVLTTVVEGGTGQPLSIPLYGLSLGQLAGRLIAAPGYSVSFLEPTLGGLSALVLLDATGDPGLSNGDHLYAYTSALWSWTEAQAYELEAAGTAISAMLAQMATPSASGEWLDLLGSYYAVPRLVGETDAAYGPRIIAEVLLPKGNNKAIEAVIFAVTGQRAVITDVVVYGNASPLFNGLITFSGAPHYYNADAAPTYGLFDAVIGYDLLGSADLATFIAQVKALVNRMRDAGTQLRNIAATGSAISDAVTTPPPDVASFGFIVAAHFDGLHRFDGGISYAGPAQGVETLLG